MTEHENGMVVTDSSYCIYNFGMFIDRAVQVPITFKYIGSLRTSEFLSLYASY
jgi:hypothetical protein